MKGEGGKEQHGMMKPVKARRKIMRLKELSAGRCDCDGAKSLRDSDRHILRAKEQKNNTRDSNVVPHRSTSLARQCLTSLSRREAVLSLWYGRSCW